MEKKEINFVYLEEVEKTLDIALSTKTNIILYGPGGFGKTELVKKYIKKHNLTSNVVVGYKNMMVEALLGIPDMQKLMNDSEYQIAFDKSVFMGAEVLVLEEFLDVMPETAAALKDIITEGGYRQKGIFIKSDIKMVIMITNKPPTDIVDDDNLKAFYEERFPIRIKVDWVIRSAAKYHNLLQLNTELPDVEIKKLAYICEKSKSSPRIALKAASLIKITNNFESISVISDFENINIKEFTDNIEFKYDLEEFTATLRKALKLVTKFSDNIGIQLYIKGKVADLNKKALAEHRRGSIQTLLGTIQQNINLLNYTLKTEINKEYKEEIDETFRDFKL
jgi:MoxR-like ATPase